mgnify:CR=1 FL=1
MAINKCAVAWFADFIFEEYSFPEGATPAPFQHLTLKENCNAIDAGVYLPNINENFNGLAPDLGALELGMELPEYGPRGNNSGIIDNNKVSINNFKFMVI